jgi:DNA modification methylase
MMPENGRIIVGDCMEALRDLADGSVNACVTSPPYFGLRDYGTDGQIGLEATPAEYVAKLVAVFREVRRVLRDDGTLWLNLGDSYGGSATIGRNDANRLSAGAAGGYGGGTTAPNMGTLASRAVSGTGLRPKDLIGIPWRVAFALQEDGWWLRQDIIWSKPNPMPESVRDRCTKAHEYIFLLSKSERYYFDAEAMREDASSPAGPGNRTHKHTSAYAEGDHRLRTKAGLLEVGPRSVRNRRSVWTVGSEPYAGAHFAVFPSALIEPCILAGSPPGGVVLDPFFGAGTTGVVAVKHGRRYVGIEINPGYAEMASGRIAEAARQGDMFVAAAAGGPMGDPGGIHGGPDQPLPLLCEQGSPMTNKGVRSNEI